MDNPHILVIDDNQSVRMIVKMLLEPLNPLLAKAENGRRALVHLRDNRPDLILSGITGNGSMLNWTGWLCE